MAANAAIYPKKDLEAASAALLKCLSSRVWITNYASCSHCHPNRSTDYSHFPFPSLSPRRPLSCPTPRGSAPCTARRCRVDCGGCSKGRAAPRCACGLLSSMSCHCEKTYRLTNFAYLMTHLLNRYFAYYQRTSANASFIKELLTFDM